MGTIKTRRKKAISTRRIVPGQRKENCDYDMRSDIDLAKRQGEKDHDEVGRQGEENHDEDKEKTIAMIRSIVILKRKRDKNNTVTTRIKHKEIKIMTRSSKSIKTRIRRRKLVQ